MTLTVEVSDDLAACLDLRRIVFIEEDGVSVEDEVDGKDGDAIHLLARLNGEPVGTARVLAYGTTVKIGRVCVLKEHRGRGLGVLLIEGCHDAARGAGATRAILAAKTVALPFYERLGYRAYGDVFIDADMPHKMMECSL
mgnify:CR=1 FL=1